MTTKTWLTPLLAVIALLIAIAWMAGMFHPKIEPGLAPVAASPSDGDIYVATESQSSVSETISATLTAKQATLISSRILAGITRIHVRSGDSVKQGQLLIDLERRDYLSRQAQAEQNVNSIQARLTEADANFKRIQALRDQNLVAIADLDKAKANVDSLKAELQAAEKRVQEATAAVSFTTITSPIDGRVVDRFAEPGDTASPGVKLLSLYNPLSLRIEGNVREQLALSLKLGETLEVDIPSLNLHTTAIVEEVVPAVDPGSRSFQIKASLAYQPELLPGMYARLHIPAGTVTHVVIPSDRVAQVGQLDMVWVQTPTGVQSRFVKTGKRFLSKAFLSKDGKTEDADKGEEQLMVEIISGVKAGEKILPVPVE